MRKKGIAAVQPINRCDKCKGSGYLSMNWEAHSNAADGTVICDCCDGNWFCGDAQFHNPVLADGAFSAGFQEGKGEHLNAPDSYFLA